MQQVRRQISPGLLKFLDRRLIITLIWLGFVGYVLRLAPLDRPETLPIVLGLLGLGVIKVNPYLVAIFWLMGVWPMIYAGLMFADGRVQKLPAFPAFLASNATGIIGLAPYLILRQRNQTFWGKKDNWLRLLDSRGMGMMLSLITLGLIFYAVNSGSWSEFVQQWCTIPFVHLISLDFCLMALLFPLSPLLDDDMARRGVKDARIFWAIALFPLFGPLAYLCLRPSLPDCELSGVRTSEAGC